MLNGQIALVTGASRGIGKAIALELGRLGAVVLGTATTEEGAVKISAYLAEFGIKGEGYVLEVREQSQIDGVMAQIEKAYGPVSVLVNNAGITRDNLAMRMKDEEWDAVLDTNLKSVFRLSKAVMRGKSASSCSAVCPCRARIRSRACVSVSKPDARCRSRLASASCMRSTVLRKSRSSAVRSALAVLTSIRRVTMVCPASSPSARSLSSKG